MTATFKRRLVRVAKNSDTGPPPGAALASVKKRFKDLLQRFVNAYKGGSCDPRGIMTVQRARLRLATRRSLTCWPPKGAWTCRIANRLGVAQEPSVATCVPWRAPKAATRARGAVGIVTAPGTSQQPASDRAG